MPLSYADVLDRYDRAQAFGDTRSLPDFAKAMNDMYGTNDYDAGMRDGPWTRFSTRLDQNVFQPLASITTEPIGQAVGGMFGHPDIGAEVGRGIPRALMDTLPMYLAGPEAGIPATIAAAAGTGGLMAAHTYADTGSPTQSLISGVTGAALPAVGHFAGGIAAKLAGAQDVAGDVLAPNFSRVPFRGTFPTEAGYETQQAARFVGSQTGQILANQASMYASDKAAGVDYNPGDPHFWLNQLPFTVHDAITMAGAPRITAESIKQQLLPKINPTPKETPAYVPTTKSGDAAEAAQARTEKLLVDLADTASSNLDPQVKAAKLAALATQINDPKQVEQVVQQKAASDTKEAAPTTPTANPLMEPVSIVGQGHLTGTDSYRIRVNDIQTAAKLNVAVGDTVFINNVVPTMDSATGQMKFDAKVSDVIPAKRPLTDDDLKMGPNAPASFLNQPELPVRADDVALTGVVGTSPEEEAMAAQLKAAGIDSQMIADHLNQLRVLNHLVPTTNADRQIMVQFGIPVDQMPEQMTVENKQALADHEQAEQRETQARQKADAPLDSAEAIQQVLPANAETKEQIATRMEDGTTATNAVDAQNKANANEEIDSATMDQNIAEHKVVTLFNQPQANRGAAMRDADGDVRYFVNEAYADTFLQNYLNQFPAERGQWAVNRIGKGKEMEGKFTITKIEATGDAANGASQVPGQVGQGSDEALSGLAYHNAQEKTRSEIEQWINDHTEGDEERPELSYKNTISSLQKAQQGSNAKVFARSLGLDASDPIAVLKATRIAKVGEAIFQLMSDNGKMPTLDEVNAALKTKGTAPLKDIDEMKSIFRQARGGADDFNGKFRSVTLDSVPDNGDPEIMNKIGLNDFTPIKNWLNWFVNHPDSGIMGVLVKDLMNALPGLGIVELRMPDHPEWEYGNFFNEGPDNMPFINMGAFPRNEQEAFEQALTLAHETAHYAFREILNRPDYATLPTRRDPTALQLLETLRQAREVLMNSKQLPKEVRAMIKQAIAEDHYSTLSRGDFSPLHLWQQKLGDETFRKYWSIAYGLLNHDELLATLFGNPEMVSLASTTKMPKNAGGIMQNVLDWFSASWAKIRGLDPKANSALSHILQGVDQYIQGGKKGEGYTSIDYVRDGLLDSGVHPNDLAQRMNDVFQLGMKGRFSDSLTSFEVDHGPIDPKIKSALMLGGRVDASHLLADQVQQHWDLWNYLKTNLRVTKGYMSNINQGLIEGMPQNIGAMDMPTRLLYSLYSGLKAQNVAIQRFNDLENFTQSGMETALARGLSDTRLPSPPDLTGVENEAFRALGLKDAERIANQRDVLEGESPLSGFSGWLRKTFQLTQFLKQQIPGFRPVADHVSEAQANMNHVVHDLNFAYNCDPKTGDPDPERLKMNQRVASEPKLNEVASDIKRRAQIMEKNGKFSWQDPFVQNRLATLSPADQKAVKSEFESHAFRHKVWTETIVPKFLSDLQGEQTAHALIALSPGMTADQARQISKSLYVGLGLMADTSDPANAALGVQTVQAVSRQLDPDVFLRAISLSQGLVQDGNKMLDFMRSRPNYVTEQRMDKHHIVMQTPNNKPHRESFDSRQAALARVQELEGKGYTFLDFVEKAKANVPATGMREDFLQATQDLDKQASDRLMQSLQGRATPDVLQEVAGNMNRSAEYAQSLNANAPVPGAGVGRRLVAGRETLDMVNQANAFQGRAANWMRNKMLRAQTAVDLMDPTLQSNPEAKALAQQHVENNLTPDNPMARKAVEATYYWKLAWNFGVNMLHGIQSLTTGMASVIAETGHVGDAFDYTGRAMKEMLNRYRPGGSKKFSSPDLDWFMNRFTAEGHAGWGGYDEFIDPVRNAVLDQNTPASLAGKGLGIVKSAATSWTGMFLKYNDSVGGLAGYMIGRDRGMSREDAYRFAVDLKDRGYYTGGKAQRGVGLWSIKTKAVPQLMSSLNTYTFGWFSQLANNWSRGFGEAPEGTTTTQRSGARKAFLYQLGAQAVLAGALGMPGMGQGLALMKQVSGVDTKDWLKQNLGKMFQDDADHGAFMSTLAMHGLVAGVTPIDPSGRHMISFPFTGVNPYKGFDPANFLPAPVTGASDLVKGILGAAKGTPGSITQMLPHVLQGPYKLMEGEGDVRDANGALLYQMNGAQRFIQALGMDSSAVQEAKETNEMLKQANAKALKEQELAQDALARQLRQGDVDGVQKQMLQWKQDHPEADMTSFARGIASKFAAQTVPLDLRSRANPAADLAGIPETTPQNSAHRQAVQQASQSLGLRSKPNAQADRSAALTDQMMQSNPYMTGAEARRASGIVPSAARQTAGLWSQAFQ